MAGRDKILSHAGRFNLKQKRRRLLLETLFSSIKLLNVLGGGFFVVFLVTDTQFNSIERMNVFTMSQNRQIGEIRIVEKMEPEKSWIYQISKFRDR